MIIGQTRRSATFLSGYGIAAGVNVATATAAAINAAAGSALGVSEVLGTDISYTLGVGASIGTGAVTASGAKISSSTGSAAGVDAAAAVGVDANAWTVTFSQTFSINDLPYNGATLRQIIGDTRLSTSGTKIRVTVESGNSGGFVLQELWIGEQAASGDLYDMKASSPAPTQILFSGSGALTLATATQRVSDALTFTLDETKSYVFGAYFNGTSTLGSSSSTGTHLYYKYNINEAGTANATTGYSDGTAYTSLITKIEVQ